MLGIRLAAPLVLFLLGAVALFAAERHLWANFLLALLLALWVGAASLVRGGRHETMVPPATTGNTERAREQRRLVAYLDLSPAPLVTLDGENRLYAVNRAARRLFGCDDRVPDPHPELVAAIAGAVPGRSASIRLAFADERRDFALAIADLVQAGAGLRIAALVDIGAELRAAEASALRELLQILSHEIMNALTPIASLSRTAADMLAEGGSMAPGGVRDAVETVARRAEGLERFTTAYRDLARLPPPAVRRVDPRLMIVDVVRMAPARWPELNITADTDRAPATIAADPDQVHAALWAIVQNAAEAGAREIHITAAATPIGTAIAVADDGPGIPEADREAVFRPFFTTKNTGSGVGLALVRQIAHSHQGSAILDSDLHGTTVRIEIPGR